MPTITSTSVRTRSLIKAVCVSALLLGCPSQEPASPPPGASEEPPAAAPAPDLVPRISAGERFAVGGPVTIDFALRNRGSAAVNVLVWNTPLEGIQGEIFRVSRDGQALAYTGLQAKRGDPMLEEYRRIEPGAELAASVDLATAYDLAAAGDYEVSLETNLADVAPAAAALPRARDSHEGVELHAGPIRFRVE